MSSAPKNMALIITTIIAIVMMKVIALTTAIIINSLECTIDGSRQ